MPLKLSSPNRRLNGPLNRREALTACAAAALVGVGAERAAAGQPAESQGADPGHTEGALYQYAYVVDDLEAAAKYWVARSAGPFFALPDVSFPKVYIPEDAPSPTISILLGYSGRTLLELIEVKHDPSELFATPSKPGPHHVARLASDMNGAIAAEQALGNQCLFHGKMAVDASVAFIDTRRDIGMLTELVSLNATTSGMLSAMYGASLTFDGTDPVRSF